MKARHSKSIDWAALEPKVKAMRQAGLTITQISEALGIKYGALYYRYHDIDPVQPAQQTSEIMMELKAISAELKELREICLQK